MTKHKSRDDDDDDDDDDEIPKNVSGFNCEIPMFMIML